MPGTPLAGRITASAAPVNAAFLAKVSAETLNALAGILQCGGGGRIGNAEIGRGAEGRAMNRCNTFRGQVTAKDGSFTAGPLMSTKMACTSPELTAQETAVLANLQSATAYTIEGDTLTITGGDAGLVFTAA